MWSVSSTPTTLFVGTFQFKQFTWNVLKSSILTNIEGILGVKIPSLSLLVPMDMVVYRSHAQHTFVGGGKEKDHLGEGLVVIILIAAVIYLKSPF
jgi:hypothetical protein